MSAPCRESTATAAVLSMLERLDALVSETPADPQPQRFGNPAFKAWHAKMKDESLQLLEAVLQPKNKGAAAELAGYLHDSFGNATRIDYGSGHELAFVALLCCLSLLEVFEEGDMPALVFRIFDKYLRLARRIQQTYSLEPAGSHGVWGLDDHQFLPYLFGSAQLVGGGHGITPQDIGSQDTARRLANEQLFFGAVDHIFKVKTGPFFEHSRYLYDMSGVAEWKKLNTGLMKMFDAEVLYKFPVIQHFLFGSLLEIDLPERTLEQQQKQRQLPGAMPIGVAPWAMKKGATGAAGAQGQMPPPPGGAPLGVAPWAKQGGKPA